MLYLGGKTNLVLSGKLLLCTYKPASGIPSFSVQAWWLNCTVGSHICISVEEDVQKPLGYATMFRKEMYVQSGLLGRQMGLACVYVLFCYNNRDSETHAH